jgi:hypothetical protein
MSTTTPTAPALTIHSVLASAYRGRSEDRATVDHASLDDGRTSLCGRVKPDMLADVGGDAVTCAGCLRKMAKLSR